MDRHPVEARAPGGLGEQGEAIALLARADEGDPHVHVLVVLLAVPAHRLDPVAAGHALRVPVVDVVVAVLPGVAERAARSGIAGAQSLGGAVEVAHQALQAYARIRLLELAHALVGVLAETLPLELEALRADWLERLGLSR
ncbi:MAG: hypothetical protein WKF40_02665 [Thermoleophilaceae bacterium]